MRKKLKAVFAMLSLSVVSLLCGCGNGSHSPDMAEGMPEAPFIDEQIVLETSELAEGVVGPEETVFDLSHIQMVQDGTFNDLEISYWTGSSCDEDAWVYDYHSRSWRQIGFDNAPDVGCWTTPAEHFHILSAAGIDARHVLDRDNRVRLRVSSAFRPVAQAGESSGGEGNPTVRALRIHADYHALSLVGSEPRHCYGLAFDGETLWVSERGKLLRLSVRGEVLDRQCAPGDWPVGLAFNGSSLLVADKENTLSTVTLDGYGFGGWPLPTGGAGGLTYSPHRVWVGERFGPNLRIYGMEDTISVDPDGHSFRAVPDTLAAPGGPCRGLAWDGYHLLVASDSLYTIAVSGEVLSAYALPVAEVQDIAWDGEALWLVNRGPTDLQSRDQVVTRFRLR